MANPVRPGGSARDRGSAREQGSERDRSERDRSARNRGPRPFGPRLAASAAYRLHALLAANAGYRALAGWIERHPRFHRAFTAGERSAKEALFGCRMCAQCALPVTGYACPMTCPKQLRNGPCGGVAADGGCEVYPDLPCVWVLAHERAETSGHGADLDLLHRPLDQREWGRSSWLNYWQGRDEGLWAATDPRPLLRRDLGLTPR